MLSFESAHSIKGLTSICYTKDGNCFVTCGQDGDIHLFEWKKNLVEHIRCSDQCFSIVIHDSHLFVGTNRNELEVRSFPHGDSLPSLAHFTQPVSTLCLSNSLLFIGTKDFQVVMIDLNKDSNEIKSFPGHEAPILSLSVHCDKRLLSTSCCDGSLRIFHIDKQTLIKQFHIICKCNDIETSPSLVKTDWDLIDNLLAIPVNNSIHFYETNQWTRKCVYENDSIVELINLISYSPCGNLFVVAYVNGQLSIVNRVTLNLLINYSNKDTICGLAWNPSETHRFTCTTMAGEFCHVDVSEYLSENKWRTSEKDENVIEKMVTENDDSSCSSNDVEKRRNIEDSMLKWSSNVAKERIENAICEFQQPFQSTSTSIYIESRFLLWNSIGAITSYSCQIEISFHDVSFHHKIIIDNKTDKYSIGDLSLSAIVLASSSTGKCLCLLYQSWDSQMKEWTINTENNEKIELVRLTEHFLAICTSQRLIRLMSLAGIQQRVIRIQGAIVCLSSYVDQLWIIHHSTQKATMFYVIINLGNDDYHTSSLPLTGKSKLIWMGYSDTGKEFYLEKSGQLTLLRRTKTNQYEPLLICNLKQQAEKNGLTSFWLLGINDLNGKLELRVIELRGQSYPDIVPWPLVSIISPSLPFYQIETEKSQLESDYFKLKFFSHSNRDDDDLNDERQCLIKMFALACKSNQQYRAFQICQLMDSVTLQYAIKYSTKSAKLTLAQKINDELIEQKQVETQKEIRRYSPPPVVPSTTTISVEQTFAQTKTTPLNICANNEPFSNPFRKRINSINQTTTDELSQWKPSINKSRLSSNKITNQSHVDSNVDETIHNQQQLISVKRKIDQDQTKDNDNDKNKRNKLRQFACHQ